PRSRSPRPTGRGRIEADSPTFPQQRRVTSPRPTGRGRIEADRTNPHHGVFSCRNLHAPQGVAELKPGAAVDEPGIPVDLHAPQGVAELKRRGLNMHPVWMQYLHAPQGVAELKRSRFGPRDPHESISPRPTGRGRIEAPVVGLLLWDSYRLSPRPTGRGR